MESIEQILRRYGAGLERVCASYEADPFLRDDLLQDVLLAIHRSLPTLRDGSRLAPFVFRIAHNRGVTHVVRQRAAKAVGLEADADELRDPEMELVAKERVKSVHDAVRRLPLAYRQAITLLLEEMSYAEIAETLGISVSNVGVRVNRGKSQLKELLSNG